MNVDHVNSHSSFNDNVYMSNLCQEITLPTTPLNHIDDSDDTDSEIALCVLSAINVGVIKDLGDLEELLDNIVRGLDFVITNQDYPVKAATKMLKRRSIGIGVTNLAYYLAKNGYTYEDKESLALVDELMEHIQFYAIKASVKLAQEFGPCEWFNRTKYSKGILPIDTYSKNVDKIVNRLHTLDWEGLRADVLKYGMRNSTLTALMPCESSAVATNSTNGMEPIRSLITTKKSKQGLIRQVAPEIHKLKNKYQLAYDMEDNKGIINIQAVIQKWIDQSISSNHYYDLAKYEGGDIPISSIVDDILYSYKMGLKTLYYANTNDGKTDVFTNKAKETATNDSEEELEYEEFDGCEGGACSI
jgi:ribonucleoside-diphosphate reductase alpha chain